MDQASLLLLNLAFMFDRKSLLKIKKLMITPESFLSFNSTLRKFNIHSRSTDVLKSQPCTLPSWQLYCLGGLLELSL